MKLISTLFTFLLLTSCAAINPYSQWYTQYTDEFLPPTDDIRVEEVSYENLENTQYQLFSEGYQQIGQSNFNGAIFDNSFAVSHAKDIGASLVVIAKKYIDSNTYTSGVVTYGLGVAPVTSTQRRFDQHATYFSKELKPLKFGVYFEVLTPEQKEEYKTNYGLRVRAVVNKSPFFNAGVLPGDIILEIDDRKLFTLEDFYDDDNSSSIIFRRGEETLTKEITSS